MELNEEQQSAFVDMLIEELPQYGIDTSKWEYDHGDCCYGGAVEFIARCIKGWVSVESKPEIGKWILLFNGHWIGVGRYQPDEDDECPRPAWSDETGEWITPEPTHWMLLPAPPSQSPPIESEREVDSEEWKRRYNHMADLAERQEKEIQRLKELLREQWMINNSDRAFMGMESNLELQFEAFCKTNNITNQ